MATIPEGTEMNFSLKCLRWPVVATLMAVATAAWPTTPEQLEARLIALDSELQTVKAELSALRAQPAVPAAGALPIAAPALSWFGYGELNYSRPGDNPAEARADVGRFVLGTSYRFDDRTRLVTELEIEHAIASSSDAGEVEVEQAYIEHALGKDIYAKAGLMLMPVGMLNESHEPTRYHGVFRNFIETAIIPTTWREGGVGLQGTTRSGLRWDAGFTTGFDLSKWDATSQDGSESPLGSIHQELSVARAASMSGYAAVNYTGLTGLRLGASLFSGDAAQRQSGFDNNRVTLWETHARWQPGAWDLSALYARGRISHTAPVNLTLIGNPTLIPARFYGWYAEAAWRATRLASWQLTPFARYERFNTASAYEGLPFGLTPTVLPDREALTAGISLTLAPGVVIKMDYVDFLRSRFGDRFDLGLGYQF
jgi:hypothetical protein